MGRAFLAALLLAAAPAAADSPFIEAPRAARARLPPKIAPTHSAPLYVFILKGSGWTSGAVARRLAEARLILGQCGLLWAPIQAAESEPPTGSASLLYDREGSAAPNGLGTVARALAGDARPAIFYVGGFEDNED